MGIEGHMQKEWERFVGKTAQTSVAARFFAGLGINLSAAAMQLVTVGVVVYGVVLTANYNTNNQYYPGTPC